MASTDLITYLLYMSTWDTENDENINCLISEHNLFVNLGDFESDSVVDKEFGTINDLACEVRDTTIAADAVQMAADAAAVASIWSFGLGMAAFVALEVEAQIERNIISSKSKKLNQKLTTVDTDISSQINDNVNSYVIKYKENNNLIASKSPKGLDTRTCRSNLLQFMAEVERKSKTLDAATFRKYAESARIVYNSDEINKVYDALDTLNFSARTDADVKEYMDVLVGLKLPENAQFGLSLVRGFSVAIMSYKLKIANNTIKAQAEAAGIPVEEVESSAFETMDAVGKFATVVAVVMSVVDVVLDIIDIVDVVEQCKTMCDKLNTTIKDSYKSYFNGIKTAAQNYKAAISGNPPSPSPQPPAPSLQSRLQGIETTDNCPHVFGIGTDDTLYLNWRDSSGGWSGWGANWNNAPKLASVFAIETTDNCPHVFGIGTDNTLYLNWRDSSGGWSGWGANWNNAPKLASVFAIETTDNCPHVFGIGTDNTLYLNWRDSSGGWSGWGANWNNAPKLASVFAIETTDNCPHVFGIGTDNTLYLNWRDSSGGWSGWGANWNNAPKLASVFAIETTDNCPHVFGIGTDNTLYLNWRDSSGGWSGWGANWNNAPKLASIFAIETTDNCPHVFGIGTDNTLYLNWRDSSGGWSGWIANWD